MSLLHSANPVSIDVKPSVRCAGLYFGIVLFCTRHAES